MLTGVHRNCALRRIRLKFDHHEERTAVEAFLKGIKLAAEAFLDDPLGIPMISNWSRVAAGHGIFDRLLDVVERDHAWNPAAETAKTPA